MNKIPKYLIGLIATAVGVFLIWYFRDIVAYMLVAAVLAIIGKPLMEKLVRIRLGQKHLPRWAASLMTLLIMWIVIVAFFVTFIPLIASKLHELSTLEAWMLSDSFTEPLVRLQNFIRDTLSIEGDFSLTGALLAAVKEALNLNVINQLVGSIVSVIGDTAVALFSITFITFFFLKEDNLFTEMIVTLAPRRYEQNIRHAMESITRLLIRYFTGILAESTILFTLVSVVLLLFGMGPANAFFLGMIVGVLNVIPYIGPLIAACICIFIGMLSPIGAASPFDMLLIVGGTVAASQLLDNVVLQPVLYSNSVKAHPLEIFIVILAAGSIGGVLGMLIAIPSYNVIRVFAKEFFNRFRVVQKLTEKM